MIILKKKKELATRFQILVEAACRIKQSKVGDRSPDLPAGSLFNSYYTEV